jgi:hypothetical protein
MAELKVITWLAPLVAAMIAVKPESAGDDDGGNDGGSETVAADALIAAVLKLLFNLSFDVSLRDQMVSLHSAPFLDSDNSCAPLAEPTHGRRSRRR